jgi:hypothetical protein
MCEMFAALQFRGTFTRIIFVKVEAYSTVALRVVLCGREACTLILSEGVLFHTVH